ncbi:MAG: xanthine dehydrogenase family protein molybdopterin-binding subunit [Sphingomonadales bacterium]|nr:xanthine dehydrogenase family protein molybdopterin-binding subunit [Sphingomonadales bacterium]
MDLSRRQILVGTAAGSALILAWTLLPRRYAPPLAPGKGEFAFDAWLRIGRDGVVTVSVPELEMGQGVTTVLPQIVAMELGADWRQIAVEPAPPAEVYANGPLAARWREMWMPLLPGLAAAPDSGLARSFAEGETFVVAADGTTLAAYEASARATAAAARAMLSMAAADRWDVRWEECEARDGFVIHGKQRLPFGALVEAAATFDAPRIPVLRPEPPAERPADVPPGANLRFPRLDLPAKVDGSYLFAGDVRLPDLIHAAIRHAPLGESVLGSFDAKAAEGFPGVIGLVRHKRWLAALATDWWAAERALTAIAPHFSVKGAPDTGKIDSALEAALHKGDGVRLAEAGDPDTWLSGHFTLASRYEVAPALHATLETASATARFSGGKLELWIASQAPAAAQLAAAEALDIPARDVVVYPMPAGGSFDRRLEHDHAIEAAILARQAKRPVQLTWSRWQEHVAGRPRTPVAAVMAARTSPAGDLAAWKARLALPATALESGLRLINGKTPRAAMAGAAGQFDPLAIEGAVPPYAIEHLLVEHVPADIGLPTGRLRGNAHGYTAFFTECFIDELATQAKREPLSYRMALLSGQPRLAECLQRVSALAGWNGGRDGSGQGIACHRIGEGERCGHIAAVATARRDETGVRVDKISAVVDIGRIVNVDIARQQIEGGLVFGVGLALGCSTDYVQGLPTSGRLGLLGLPRLADCPEIEVEFIESGADPADPGELGVAIAAPAIANALFSATGLRFRKLPLLSEDL